MMASSSFASVNFWELLMGVQLGCRRHSTFYCSHQVFMVYAGFGSIWPLGAPMWIFVAVLVCSGNSYCPPSGWLFARITEHLSCFVVSIADTVSNSSAMCRRSTEAVPRGGFSRFGLANRPFHAAVFFCVTLPLCNRRSRTVNIRIRPFVLYVPRE